MRLVDRLSSIPTATGGIARLTRDRLRGAGIDLRPSCWPRVCRWRLLMTASAGSTQACSLGSSTLQPRRYRTIASFSRWTGSTPSGFRSSARIDENAEGVRREAGARRQLPRFSVPRCSVTGTCGEVLTIRGLPSEWDGLRSRVSRYRMNFSASMGPYSRLLRGTIEVLRRFHGSTVVPACFGRFASNGKNGFVVHPIVSSLPAS